jgi:ribosomal-protein-alanine N-acetyltransferase
MSSVQKAQSIAYQSEPLQFARMQADDVNEVLVIEYDIYPCPWTRGNFFDSLNNEYQPWVLRDASRMLVGYFLMMPVVDEAHLLNITVRAQLHGHGFGRGLLDKTIALAREGNMHSVLLEVRPSNQRAVDIYQRYGFSRIGIRRGYYPAAKGAREDAIVMRLPL